MDEPTANLDLFWREQIVDTLQQLYEQTRVTAVLVCHELEVIPVCAHRLLVLRDGKIIADGRPDSLLTHQFVESLYGPRLRLVQSGGRYAAAPCGGVSHD